MSSLRLHVLVMMLALGCTGEQAGSFSVVFRWMDPPPTTPVFFRVRVEKVDSHRLVAETDPQPIEETVKLPDVPYGEGYLAVAEIRDRRDDTTSEPLWLGISEPFDLRPNERVEVPVNLQLTSTEGTQLGVVDGLEVEGARLVRTSDVTLSISPGPSDRVIVANERELGTSARVLDVQGFSMDSKKQGRLRWDLNAGLCSDSCKDGSRTVYARFLRQGVSYIVRAATVVLDSTTPKIVDSQVRLVPAAGNPLGATVKSIGPGTWLRVDATFGESVRDLRLNAVNGESTINVPATALTGTSARFELEWPTGAEGDYALLVSATDLAGNLTNDHPLGSVRADATPPTTPDLNHVVYVRAPWGSVEDGTDRAFRVALEAGSVVEGDSVLAYDQAEAGQEIGQSVDVAATGASLLLAEGNRSAVWIQAVDGAGNQSPRVQVLRGRLLANLRGKQKGASAANPHQLRVGSLTPTHLEQGVEAQQSELDAIAGMDDGKTLLRSTGIEWQRRGISNVWPPRFSQAMAAFDRARGRLVLLDANGGNESNAQQVWEWDGEVWHRTTVTGGPGLGSRFMTYDAARGRIVVPTNEAVWEWDGQRWDAAPTPGGPTPSNLIYDSRRQKVLMFAANAGWEWSGQQWEPLVQAGMGDASFLVYMPDRGSILAMGAHGSARVYDGAKWTNLAASGSPMPAGDSSVSALVYDEKTGNPLVVSYSYSGADHKLFSYRLVGNNWVAEAQASVAPSMRWDPALAYDPVAEQVALFGGFASSDGLGFSQTDELWLLPAARGWRQVIANTTVPPGRISTAMASLGEAGVLLYGGDPGAAIPLSDTWLWDGFGWTQRAITGPGPRRDHQMEWDPLSGAVLLTGGSDQDRASQWYGTWSYTAQGGWSVVSASPEAGKTQGDVMAIDLETGTCLLGHEEGTYRYNRPGWSLADAAGNGPIAYDAQRGEIVGLTSSWNGTTWEERDIESPSLEGVDITQLQYDPASQRVLAMAEGVTLRLEGDRWEDATVADATLPRVIGAAYDAVSGKMLAFAENVLYEVRGKPLAVGMLADFRLSGLGFSPGELRSVAVHAKGGGSSQSGKGARVLAWHWPSARFEVVAENTSDEMELADLSFTTASSNQARQYAAGSDARMAFMVLPLGDSHPDDRVALDALELVVEYELERTHKESTCGNGQVEPWSSEECDDGNPSDGDGCSGSCRLEVGSTCDRLEPSHCTSP